MTEPDVRWLQRLENDSKALPALARGVAVARERQLSELEEQGLIQAFEFTHELSWLLLRDDLVDQAPVASAIPGMQSEKLWCAASRAGVRPCPRGAAGGSHTTGGTAMNAASSPPAIPGLSEQHCQAILELLIQQSEVEAVVLYGSRAMGRQHPGSDIDLCLQAPEMTLSQLLSLGADLDELLLPWPIDLQLRHCINHPPLLEHIDRVGVTMWQRAGEASDLNHPMLRATPSAPQQARALQAH